MLCYKDTQRMIGLIDCLVSCLCLTAKFHYFLLFSFLRNLGGNKIYHIARGTFSDLNALYFL